MFEANVYNPKETFAHTLIWFKTEDLQLAGIYLMFVYALFLPLGLATLIPLTIFGVLPCVAYILYQTFVPDTIKKIFIGSKLRHLYNKKLLVPDSLNYRKRIYPAVYHDLNTLSNSMTDLSFKDIPKMIVGNKNDNQEFLL